MRRLGSENKRIGKLIQIIRRRKGMTQAQLAKIMRTSQSAINRIESGQQNLSLEIINRLSQILEKPLINIGDDKISLRISGGHRLSGEITIKNAKNTTLALMFAALINQGKTTLMQVPKIEEIFRIIEVFESLGVHIKWQGDNLEIKPPEKMTFNKINQEAAKVTRSSLMLIGSAVKQHRKFNLPFSGGCRLGERSIKGHAYALENLGINIKVSDEVYKISAKLKASKTPIIMYESGDTATINILLAAAQIEAETEIKMASANYQVQDVCHFLKELGIEIEGIGTPTLKVKGNSRSINRNIEYFPAEDPIEAMTVISAAITTDSEILIKRAPLDFLDLELLKIRKMNCPFKILREYAGHNQQLRLGDILIQSHFGQLQALEDKISCRPYPGLNIDNLPYFVPIAATAKGKTLIHDWVYENRALYYMELNHIGADIQLADPHRVYVNGPTKWHPADLNCPPAIRPATINLIAMLAAPGVSILRNIYTINRGYENVMQTYNNLGAKIEIIRDF